MTDARSPLYALAERYVEELARLDPVFATAAGVPGHEAELTDYSPEGIEAQEALARRTLAELRQTPETDELDRVAGAFMGERLGAGLAFAETGEHLRALRAIGSPMGSLRQVFDLMPRESEADWETIAARLERVPGALAGFRASLEEGRRRGLVAARRQALECARQGAAWAGEGGAPPFFADLIAEAKVSGTLRLRLETAAAGATAAYDGIAAYLRDDYAPGAGERDAVGAERYAVFGRYTLGADIDPLETYAWGWDELHRIEGEMAVTAGRIMPGGTVEEAKQLLETDPARAINGVEAFREWMQEMQDRTVAELDGRHFDIPERVRRIEAMIAPPGGAAAMYYTGAVPGFLAAGPDVVPDAGEDALPALGRSLDRVPRGGAGAPPAGGDRAAPGGPSLGVPAGELHELARRGLGALRGAPDGRARLPRGPGLPAGDAARAGDACRARRGGHRDAPGADDPCTGPLPPGRALDASTGAGVRGRAQSFPAGLHGQRGDSLPGVSIASHLLQGG